MSPAGRPLRLLLMHGLAGSPAIWRAVCDLGVPDAEMSTSDLPWAGAGDGVWAQRPGALDVVEDALTAADVVVAHSFTANLVLELLAAGRGTGLRGVVLVSPFYRASAGEFDWPTMEFYFAGFQRILDDGLRAFAGDKLAADLREDMAARLRDRVGPYGWMQFFSAYLRTAQLDLEGIGVPVHLVAGEQDFAAPERDAKALAAAIPGCGLDVLPACGHFAMADRPELFTAVLGGFVATLEQVRSVRGGTHVR